MNKVILMGRLTRDPEVRYSQGDKPTAIARYTLAVARRYKQQGQPESDFVSCVAFGSNGEFAEKYLRQGLKIAVCGRIQTGSYTNKDGVKVYTTEVVVEEHDFAESKNSNGSSQQAAPQNDSPQNDSSSNQDNQNPSQNQPMGGEFMPIPDGIEDELPFM